MQDQQQQKIKIHTKADLKTLNTICTFSALTPFSRQQTERVVLLFFFLQVNNDRNELVRYILEISNGGQNFSVKHNTERVVFLF